MGVTPRFQQGTVAIVKMKIEGKLFCGWLPDIAAIAASLLRSQKLNWHDVLPFHTTRQTIYTFIHASAKIADEI